MTTAYHPFANGQAGRIHQTIEIALRCLLVGNYGESSADSKSRDIIEADIVKKEKRGQRSDFNPLQLQKNQDGSNCQDKYKSKPPIVFMLSVFSKGKSYITAIRRTV